MIARGLSMMTGAVSVEGSIEVVLCDGEPGDECDLVDEGVVDEEDDEGVTVGMIGWEE